LLFLKHSTAVVLKKLFSSLNRLHLMMAEKRALNQETFSTKKVGRTYKQALRGLFTDGTSASKLFENKGKGRQRTRIESCFICMMSSTSAGIKPQKMKGIIGKKLGMTSVFSADGKQTAVTIIEAGPNVVTQVKTKETDGYTALQLAFGDKKEKHSTKAENSHFAKAQTAPKKIRKGIPRLFNRKTFR
jgi:hypothetical protein